MIYAFIPLRSGSKGIPNKNIKLMNGKHLAQWVINAANESKFIQKVIVASDSEVIDKCLKNCTIFRRSDESATDQASSEVVLLEFVANLDPSDIVVFIQATSPLINSSEIDQGVEMVLQNKFDSVVSVTPIKRFIWTSDGIPNYDPTHRPRRQDWEGILVENGAFYINTVENIIATNCRISGKIGLVNCSEKTFYEIDDDTDWMIVEQLFNK